MDLHDESPAGGKLTVFENSTLRLPTARGDLRKRELIVQSPEPLGIFDLKLRGEAGRAAERKKITLRRREHRDRGRKRKRGHDISCPYGSTVGRGDEGGESRRSLLAVEIFTGDGPGHGDTLAGSARRVVGAGNVRGVVAVGTGAGSATETAVGAR